MSKDRAPYFKFYIDDFLSSDDVRAMSVAEIGAYVLLLCTAWGQEPPATLPDDDTRLARWAQMTPEEWAKSRPAVLAPWRPAGNGRLVSPRLKREHEEMQRASRAKQEAGRSGAAVRWQGHSRAMADPWQNDASPESRVQSPDPKPKAQVTPPPPVGCRTVVSLADTPPGGTDPYPEVRANPEHVRACWNAYPSSGRVGYQRARLAIGGALDVLRLRGEPDPAAWLLGRVQAFAASPAGNAGKFTPHAATWFSDGRYDDPPEAWERRVDQATDEQRMTAAKLDAILGSKP